MRHGGVAMLVCSVTVQEFKLAELHHMTGCNSCNPAPSPLHLHYTSSLGHEPAHPPSHRIAVK